MRQTIYANSRKYVVWMSMLLCFLFSLPTPSARAGNPYSAIYSTDDTKIFWFMVISDVHIGAKGFPGTEHLTWIATEGKTVINPSFIVNAGDLTDSTNWSDSGYPDGPHPEEWQQYRNILTSNGIDETFYYDIPGNHDHYNDKTFNYYLTYSIQGAATGQTQISWTRTFDFGTYHFLGINTCGNDGAEFSPLPPNYGDNAGLDSGELAYIGNKLDENKNADLTMIFGHHLLTKRAPDWTDLSSKDVEESTMTALTYGEDAFAALMDQYQVLMYCYGHSHVYREEFFTRNMDPGVIYLNVGSLTKSDTHQYSIVAIDNNGLSTVPLDVGVWPAVIITAPLDKNLGMYNDPYTSNVTDVTGTTVPVRALVFDNAPVARVEYKIYKILEDVGDVVDKSLVTAGDSLEQSGMWQPMTRVAASHRYFPYLWEADCAYPQAGGDYVIEVRATGSTTQTDAVPTTFPAPPVEEEGPCFIGTVGAASASTAEEEKTDSGRTLVQKAIKPEEPFFNLFSRSGLFATGISSSTLNPFHPLKSLSQEAIDAAKGKPFSRRLQDGTKVEGLFFEYDDSKDTPKPLLMASFGFLQDRWGTEADKFFEAYLEDPAERIPAHVLILEHPTSGPFTANNGLMSIGAYDDGRMWIEIAQSFRNDPRVSGIHLFGVSMSGQTVVHALIEDHRLGLNLFKSGMVFSIAPDFHRAPGRQLAQMTTAQGVENPWAAYFKGVPEKSFVDDVQGIGLDMLISDQFIPNYLRVCPDGQGTPPQPDTFAVYMRQSCEKRLARIRAHRPGNWRPDFSLASLDQFMDTTRIAGVIDQVRTPLAMVSAYDDPLVPRAMFEEVMQAAAKNQWIAAYETPNGGHFGFGGVYGDAYIGDIMRLMMSPDVLSTWLRQDAP